MTSDVALVAPADRLDTLPPESLDPSYWYRPGVLTLGWFVIPWAEGIMRQPNGPRAGQRWKFTPRQSRFLLHWYQVDESGAWLFHHGVRRLSKGSGKSPKAAVASLIEFAGPCRVAKILDPDHPEPWKRLTAKPVDMPLVQIAATAESQTKNTMRMVRAIAHKQSELVKRYNIDPGKTVYYKLPEGTLEVITSSATAAEGAEASFVVADETEHWKPANGGPEMASTLADNLAKSGSRMLETSNAWVPGQETVAESTWDAWVAQEEGRTRSRTKILYDAVIAPPETDMADRDSLLAALRHVYEDCAWVDVGVIANRVHDLRSKPDDSLRKYLNRPTSVADAWTTSEDWSACSDSSVVVADGDEIVAFFDGSKSQDATVLMGCRVADGHVFLIAAWEKPLGADDGWQVPVDEVDAAVEVMFDTWDVAAFFADVKEWESYVHTAWPTRHGEDLVLWAQKTGRNAGPVAWDMRAHVMDFTLAAEACLSDIEGREFTHDGDALVHRHVTNARRRPNRWGVSVGKEARGSARKVDAAVCVIGVRMVRRLLLASPEWAARDVSKSKAPGRVVGWG